jgi:mycobactin lysine-N-oxygenase
MARLAIIGAGPKGAAIAAKAAALQAAKHPKPPPDIVLYDPKGVGAAWRGSIGYTDGVQPLCTRAERDLGFPYDTQTYGPKVAQAMHVDFSWQSFAITSAGYHDWVVKGRNPPPHIDFANYLDYAVKKAVAVGAASLIPETVSAVDFVNATGTWRIESKDSSGATTSNDYDGVVITGSGRPHIGLRGANRRVFNGLNFWQSIPEILRLLSIVHPEDAEVAIIGAGGTGAAIAYWFVRNRFTSLPITIIGCDATLFARHDGPFEDRLFTDESLWQDLVPHVREAFLARTTAGVVWDYVLRNLVSDKIRYRSYEAREFRNVGPGPGGPREPDELILELDAPRDPVLKKAVQLLSSLELLSLTPPLSLRVLPSPTVAVATPPPPIAAQPATVFIDARGFDRFGFVDDFFATSPLSAFFDAKDPNRRPQIESDIAKDLCVVGTLADGASFPGGLHVPGLGAKEIPAATNLMGLGLLADRVLKRYC